MDRAEQAIIDSGLFTRVEHEFETDRTHVATYVNKSRGAVAKVHRESKISAVGMYFDRGNDVFYYGGAYDAGELVYVLTVMKSDKAWAHWYSTDDDACDFTISIDKA